MARIRSIKPDFPEDLRNEKIGLQAMLLFLLMKPFCDDNGIIVANHNLIKNKCFPLRDDIRTQQIAVWVKELQENSFLMPFVHSDDKSYYVLDFSSEKIDKPQKSVCGNNAPTFDSIREYSRIVENVRAGEERRGEDKERKGVGGENEFSRDSEKKEAQQKKKEMPPPGSAAPPSVIMPWPDEEFSTQWALWKQYKAKEHRFGYKSPQSEQAALKELAEFSGGNMETAIKIIHQSMAKGWKGLFKLKDDERNQQTRGQQPGGDIRSVFDRIDRMPN